MTVTIGHVMNGYEIIAAIANVRNGAAELDHLVILGRDIEKQGATPYVTARVYALQGDNPRSWDQGDYCMTLGRALKSLLDRSHVDEMLPAPEEAKT